MKSVCAWCGKQLGTVPSSVHTDNVITHGMCDACLGKRFEDTPSALARFLDKLAGSIILIDPSGSIKAANRKAQSLLRKGLAQITGYRPGDILECANASLPGGCGKTIHCAGCTIRRTVLDTLESGASHQKTPAFLNRGTPEDHTKVDVLISTEKVGPAVLLRIDEMKPAASS